MGTRLEDIQDLRYAREATQEKRRRKGQGYQLPDDDSFYKGLYERLVKQGAGHLFVAKRDGAAVAVLFFATFNGQAYSVFSGSTDLGYRLGAQSGLFWAAVEMFKSLGFHELNRGGVSASAANESDPLHGIYRFKKSLGATPLMRRSGKKVLSPLREHLWKLKDRLRGQVEDG